MLYKNFNGNEEKGLIYVKFDQTVSNRKSMCTNIHLHLKTFTLFVYNKNHRKLIRDNNVM